MLAKAARRVVTSAARGARLASAAAVPRPPPPSTVKVSLGAVKNNVRCLRKTIGSKVLLGLALKGNAYGHGAVEVAKACLAVKNGVDVVLVASIAEAADLREAGISKRMMVMGYIPPQHVGYAVHQDIAVTVATMDTLKAYEATAAGIGKVLACHVKVDTGMGRFGVQPADAVALIHAARDSEFVRLEGVYTHFSCADEEGKLSFTRSQHATLKEVVAKAELDEDALVHCANSAAIMRGEEFHMDMVRAGISLYGGATGEGGATLRSGFKAPMSWHSAVAQVKTLPVGHAVGYGNTWVAKRVTRAALMPVGYADGLRRGPVNCGKVLIGGKRCPIIGRVSMEKTMVDVTDLEKESGRKVVEGDEIVLFGKQGREEIHIDEVAEVIGTNNYEVLTSTLPRWPREYVK